MTLGVAFPKPNWSDALTLQEFLSGTDWLCELRRALARDIVEELRHGEWIDQSISVLGRNRHVRLAKRLIRACSVDALCSDDGRWMVRSGAVDAEIARLNRDEPPAALNRTPMPPPLPAPGLARAEPDDDTGIFERDLYERVRSR